MNPFLNTQPAYKKGEKSEFYFDQFKSIKLGFENAKSIKLLEDGDLGYLRNRLNKYCKDFNFRGHTRVIDGVVWVAILEAE